MLSDSACPRPHPPSPGPHNARSVPSAASRLPAVDASASRHIFLDLTPGALGRMALSAPGGGTWRSSHVQPPRSWEPGRRPLPRLDCPRPDTRRPGAWHQLRWQLPVSRVPECLRTGLHISHQHLRGTALAELACSVLRKHPRRRHRNAWRGSRQLGIKSNVSRGADGGAHRGGLMEPEVDGRSPRARGRLPRSEDHWWFPRSERLA